MWRSRWSGRARAGEGSGSAARACPNADKYGSNLHISTKLYRRMEITAQRSGWLRVRWFKRIAQAQVFRTESDHEQVQPDGYFPYRRKARSQSCAGPIATELRKGCHDLPSTFEQKMGGLPGPGLTGDAERVCRHSGPAGDEGLPGEDSDRVHRSQPAERPGNRSGTEVAAGCGSNPARRQS